MPPMRLGKLSVVYDTAGKARVVAITNWWIQAALKPLHDSIFSNLRKCPQDGTFDQVAPLRKLYLNRDPNHKFYAYDLSSATDRLPIEIQSDILTLCKVNGKVWRNLLDFSWLYRGEEVRYAVGQPMGAYSSWGMLAVTHHVIVRLAALRAGIKGFSHYVVLGDDIVINHDIVAANYLEIMAELGVEINLSKSIVSNDIVEFAKRWLTPYGEISPIGPGLVLDAMRNPHNSVGLLREAISKGYIDTVEFVQEILIRMPNKIRPFIFLSFWAILGPLAVPLKGSQHSRNLLDWYSRLYAYGTGPKFLKLASVRNTRKADMLYVSNFGIPVEDMFLLVFGESLRDSISIDIQNNIKSIEQEISLFDERYDNYCAFNKFRPALLEAFGGIWSPGYWLLWLKYRRDLEESRERLLALHKVRMFSAGYLERIGSYSDILAPPSLGWKSQEIKWKEANLLYSRILHNMDINFRKEQEARLQGGFF
jgi:hypothetical protein